MNTPTASLANLKRIEEKIDIILSEVTPKLPHSIAEKMPPYDMMSYLIGSEITIIQFQWEWHYLQREIEFQVFDMGVPTGYKFTIKVA